MNNDFSQVEDLKSQLTSAGSDFICRTPLPYSSAIVLFLGPFHGQTVVWDMTLATLAHYRTVETAKITAQQSRLFDNQFIEIIEASEGIFQLRVGLEIKEIDEPVIKKTIIMIRNYKRLAIGRSGFGSMRT